ILSLLFFVLTVIGVFRLAGAKKTDKEKRSRAAKMTLFSLLPFFFLLIVWFFLFNFISRLEITAEKVVAEIIVVEPKETEDLQAPLEVTFSAVKVKQALANSQLSVSSAAWDLDGDGFFETPVDASGQVTRLYQQRGFYDIGLSVQVVGEATPRVYNYLLNVKDALFVAEPSSGSAPLRVQFNASALLPTRTKLESLDWDFDGDGTYDLTGDDQLNPVYTFNQIGTYNVHLRVVDENNTVQNYYRAIEIVPSSTPLLSARIEASPGLKGSVPFSVRFDGGNSSSLKSKIIRYEWDFGDGSGVQQGKTVSHVYNTSGTYTVGLTVTEDSGQTDQISVTIEAQGVTSPPKAVIKTVPESSEGQLEATLPAKVQFDASKSTDIDGDIVDYEWDFNGDGVADKQGQKVSQTFDAAGTFEVTLTVRDSEDQSHAATLTVVVTEPGVQAVVSAEPAEGTVPLTVHFDGSGSSAFEGSIVSYEWDFGDGSPATITGATINHRYDMVGTYTAALKVTTNKNQTSQSTLQIFVREVPLRACFEPSRTTGAAPLSVTFDPKCSTGSVITFSWDFGDGIQSSSRKPAHTFENPGTYTVTLEVADDKSNVSSHTAVITVEGDVVE
ncbi:MAG: PKD domain-containing protein, partial [Candidatus Peregrinibacteria bacterium]